MLHSLSATYVMNGQLEQSKSCAIIPKQQVGGRFGCALGGRRLHQADLIRLLAFAGALASTPILIQTTSSISLSPAP